MWKYIKNKVEVDYHCDLCDNICCHFIGSEIINSHTSGKSIRLFSGRTKIREKMLLQSGQFLREWLQKENNIPFASLSLSVHCFLLVSSSSWLLPLQLLSLTNISYSFFSFDWRPPVSQESFRPSVSYWDCWSFQNCELCSYWGFSLSRVYSPLLHALACIT